MLPTDSSLDRGMIGSTFGFVIACLLFPALLASLYCRGLYQDGSYYLYRVAEREWFYLVDPARTTVQVLRQAPVVLLTRLGQFSLVDLARVLSIAMLALPVLLAASCWFIVPRDQKGWALFPILHLLIGFSTTWFLAVGEAAIAASYFWILLFLLLFRTRDLASQALFLLLSIPAFGLHEGMSLLMPLLLLVCGLRLKGASTWREQAFLGISAALIVSIIVYELRWMIYPRIPGEREGALYGIYTFGFLYSEGRLNLPVVSAAIALMTLASLAVAHRLLAPERARAVSWIIAGGFAGLALLMAALPWLAEQTFSPRTQIWSRYNPIFAGIGLGLAAILMRWRGNPLMAWVGAPALAIVAALGLAQAAADIAATTRWRAYTDDFRARLARSAGLVPWQVVNTSGDVVRDREWRLMTAAWVVPLMSLIFAENGHVAAIFDYPEGVSFRPVNPANPGALPKLRGVDYATYRRALTSPEGGPVQ